MIDKYFSAGNTSMGFVNYFDDAIDRDTATQIIYIKGGSGVGKSTLMRRASDIAITKGYSVTHIHCSSDPSSLDGVVINDIKVALFDATMPHIADPLYPRVNSYLIDLGIFLDSDMLHDNRRSIISLVHSKKEHYKRLYSYLATLTSVEKAKDDLIEYDKVECIKIERELASSIGKTSHARRGFLTAISGDGMVNLTAEQANSHECTLISSKISEASRNIVDAISHRLTLDLVPHNRYYSLLAPLVSESISSDNAMITSDSTVESPDIVNIDNLFNIKNRRAYDILSDYTSNIIALSQDEIKRAQNLHAELEERYKEAMDYTKLNEYTNLLLEDIFE